MAASESNWADPLLGGFMRHILAERNGSRKTVESYAVDLQQLAEALAGRGSEP